MEPGDQQDDLVAQEAAARDYQPQLEGPLVGKKTPSTAITEEYAKADPIYVQKTMVLPQTYSHYRPVRGDGSCGWRAIGFGYFETLIKRGNRAQIEAERLRLESLNEFIENVGHIEPYVFQDMAEETFILLDRISDVIDNQESAMAELATAFNTTAVSDSIIYHFRLLASSWLKGHTDDYGAFITSDSGCEGYCRDTIERPNIEIDHLGITLLVNVLLKPVGFVLEIAYLDRSPGSEVNTFRFPEEANNQHPSDVGPIIHLLYRPDHYDLLYLADMDLQVHRVDSLSHNFRITEAPMAFHSFSAVGDLALMIPNFGSPPPGLAPSILDVAAASPLSYTPSPGSSWVSSPFTDPIQQAPPQTSTLPATVPVVTQPQAAQPRQQQQLHPLRFSEYCQLPKYVENDTWQEPTFQTSSFKNSHFNVAHYNNPNFQPEEYKPGQEEYEPPSLRNSIRKRSSV
ncbi:peptidase C65 Otubain-domain-containing protein [Bombardia bombarda]|uniref:ubiquitinyl hydrolase 1 n=1 Tax=Bombardia bombarda TaxID=252184 RepID=A0AA39X6K1_9PEZI|nr:peptidase C65 Otubain-domain-containing protein [Bombardia bombarda]